MWSARTHGALATAVLAALGVLAAAQTSPGTYTAPQAASGQNAYDQNCASCHMADLSGSMAPALAGADFLSAWGD